MRRKDEQINRIIVEILKLMVKGSKTMPNQKTAESVSKMRKKPNFRDILCGEGEARVMFR